MDKLKKKKEYLKHPGKFSKSCKQVLKLSLKGTEIGGKNNGKNFT